MKGELSFYRLLSLGGIRIAISYQRKPFGLGGFRCRLLLLLSPFNIHFRGLYNVGTNRTNVALYNWAEAFIVHDGLKGPTGSQ